MLVTFHTKAYADITLFGDIAQQLLLSMGHGGSVPGALRAEDVSAALDKLRAAVAGMSPTSEKPDDDGERPVSLDQRAQPLIALLEAARADGENVMWD
jgi:hypothetical protein